MNEPALLLRMQDAALLELGSRVLAAAHGGGGERYAPKPPAAERVAAARAALAATGDVSLHEDAVNWIT